MANKLHRQVKGLSEDKSDKLNLISGNLGISLDGQKTVEVSNRDGYVWVRLRGNQSELIQAYNAAVSPIFDLPVLVVYSNNRYSVYGRDVEKYGDWGNSPYLPKHGTQHSFNPELGMGGDVTWIYSRQFVPLLAMPSGSAGAASLVVNPHIYREPDGSFTFIGNQGTPDATLAKPTNNQARLMLLYWDLNTNLPNMITGSLFDATITGTAQITPYIPVLNDSQKIPLSAIRVVSGTTSINWDNIYDVRQFATTTPPAFQGGFGIWDEGIPQGTGTILDFIGAGITATVSGTVAQIVVTATGGGGASSPWTTGSAGTSSIKAIGGGSNATGDYAVAHGQDTLATGTASTAEGNDSVARGDYSHAEGNGTLARGDESHAEGYQTVAIGLDSHAEGQSSISSGTASHAEGQGNLAAGFAAHAGGSGNKARGDYSAVVGGIGNSALGQGSVVLGGFEVTGSSSYTAYVDRLHIQRLQTGTAVANLGMDGYGYIVTGSFGAREKLTSNRTYYVRTDGSDSNTGLVDSAGGAFLTIQKAVDVVSDTLDLGIYAVTIKVGNGTYTETTILKSYIGTGPVTIEGDTTTPSNVLISTTAENCFTLEAVTGEYSLIGMKMQTATSGHCIAATNTPTTVTYGNVEFGAVGAGLSSSHISTARGAIVSASDDYEISGGASSHFISSAGGIGEANQVTVTLTGTPAFSAAFATATRSSFLRFTSTTFSGSATGKRYSVSASLIVATNSETYLPGDTLGTMSDGGVYGTPPALSINTAQFDKTNTTLANITGLTATLLAGRTYKFTATLYTTSNVASGVKFAIAGTCTATAIIYEASVFQAGVLVAPGTSRATALATTVGNVTAVTVATVIITGQITVNVAGTLTVQFADNAGVNTSSVLVGSSFDVKDTG